MENMRRPDRPASLRAASLRAASLRAVALAGALTLAVGGLTACNTEKEPGLLEEKNYTVDIGKLTEKKQPMKEDESDLEWREDTSEFTFKMWIGIPSMKEVIGNIDTLVGQEISRLTGAKWEVEIPSSNESTVMQMMVAADNYPDIVVCPLNWSSLNSMIEGDKVLALSDLIDQYCPKMWNLIDESAMEWYTMADGKMYHMPGYITDDEAVERAQQKTNAGNLYVRQDVYNEMGRPDMSTPESFAAVLERVKNEYPDLIPLNLGYIYLTDYSMTPALKSIFNGFGVQPQGVGGDQPSVVYLEEDQVKLPYRDPNYKKALQYVNSLYRKGILTDSLLIQRQSQIDQRLNNAEYFCTGEYTSNIHTVLNPSLRQNFGEEIQYEIVDPAFASEGVTPQYPTVKSKGWMTAVITKNAKQPDRLIKFLEFCYSELGQRTMIMGKEGETYDMVDGVPKMREEYVQFKLDNNTQELNKLGFNNFAPFLMRKKYLDLYETPILQGKRPELEGDWEKMNRYATDLYAKGLGDIGPRMGSKDYVSYSRVMEQFMKNMLKMMSAKTDEDFESLYETGVKNADNAGAAEVEALLTKNHQYELEQLG